MIFFPRTNRAQTKGFTIVEVMVAFGVLTLVFFSSMVVISRGFRMVEDARFNTLASQVLQSEIETLRLKNWSELTALSASESFTISSDFAAAGFTGLTGTRTITTPRSDTRRITVSLSWKTSNQMTHSRKYVTYMCKNGLNDYYYRKL
jgi:Tfp pilus assembly protein PilV